MGGGNSKIEDIHKTVPNKGKGDEVSKNSATKSQQKQENTYDYRKIDQHARQVVLS